MVPLCLKRNNVLTEVLPAQDQVNPINPIFTCLYQEVYFRYTLLPKSFRVPHGKSINRL